MKKLTIVGDKPLVGTIKSSGSKNCTLALMAGALLGKGETILRNVPKIADVLQMVKIIQSLGVKCEFEENNILHIDATEIKNMDAPYELVNKMRAGFNVLGSVLARKGYANIPLPGGCDIGNRPVDFHIDGIKQMGANVSINYGAVKAECKKLKAAQIVFNFPSAGATQHLMDAACLADGVTTIEMAAAEPEVVELANFLKKMGAKITGEGTTTIVIEGVDELRGTDFTVSPDRMEIGTYAVMGAITKGDVTIKDVVAEQQTSFVKKLRDVGANVDITDNSMRVRATTRPMPVDIKTQVHPGFPTDMMQPFSALLSIADGTSTINETIYEWRFKYVSELVRMGANVKPDDRICVINGVEYLTGAQIEASDLRGGAALICAALAAKGKSEISHIKHIDRGYENLVEKLLELGAQVIKTEKPKEDLNCV